jgi:hypothetical protein
LGDEIKNDEEGREATRNAYRVFMVTPEGKRPL